MFHSLLPFNIKRLAVSLLILVFVTSTFGFASAGPIPSETVLTASSSLALAPLLNIDASPPVTITLVR